MRLTPPAGDSARFRGGWHLRRSTGTAIMSFANLAAARLLSAKPPADALVGKPVHELLHGAAPQGGSRLRADDCIHAARRRRSRGSCRRAGTSSAATAQLLPAEYVLTPLFGQNRSSNGFVLSFRDISQRFALDRLKDEFISTVSHELRTPLTSIRGALGLLSSGILGKVSDKASNLLRIALTNSDRLVRLINDILGLGAHPERARAAGLQTGASWRESCKPGLSTAFAAGGRCRRRAKS